MSRQWLIYESAVPVSSARHLNVSVETLQGYGFSAGINAVPLLTVEFQRAAAEYAIVFTPAGDEVVPAVVLGIRADQNLYLSQDAQWRARYIPAFIRRYPFVFSPGADGRTPTLCIDESYPGLNREGRGQRLFGDNGQPAPYVDAVLWFLREYQLQFERTLKFVRHVKELGLLEPMRAQVASPAGSKFTLHGFQTASRPKLRALNGRAVAALSRTDELELLHLHMQSIRNFDVVRDRLFGTLATGREADAAGRADGRAPAQTNKASLRLAL
jgi:SapC